MRDLLWLRIAFHHISEFFWIFVRNGKECFDFRATILQHESSKVGKISTESLAKPAVMRAGTDGMLVLILF